MADQKEKKFHYGGQAVIEGVMMRGPKDFAVAVRRANGEIVTTKEDVESIFGKLKFLDKPFLRGTLALIDAMVLGMKALLYSSSIAFDDISEAEKAEKAKKKNEQAAAEGNTEAVLESAEPKKKNNVNDMVIGITMFLGLALGVVLFFLVPILIVKPLTTGMVPWQRAICEGGVKITLFVLYIGGISFLPDIRRVFQYHGAEHKTINAYEDKVELTVENVKNYTKEHVRCGTSFILVVLVTSIVVFMFVHTWTWYLRLGYKLLLLPFIAGIAYEVIRFAGSRKDSIITKILVAPGLLMQKITTREPEPEMIEVAIKSLQSVLDREASHTDECNCS